MRKKLVSILLALAFIFALVPSVGLMANAASATDLSTWVNGGYAALADKKLAINDVEDFKLFQSELSVYGRTFEGYTIYLNADLDLNPGWETGVSLEWDENGLTADSVQSGTNAGDLYVLPAIDTTNNTGKSKQFGGVFEGQGHSLSGLYLNLNAGNAASVFGQVIGTATVKDLAITNSYFGNGGADLTASKPLAAIFTNVPKGTTATISNCYIDVDLYEKSTSKNGNIHAKMGGLVGYCAGALTIENSVYAGSMSFNTASGTKRLDNAGGFVGLVEGAAGAGASVTITNSVFTGTIWSPYQRVAGFIGRSQGTATINMTNCLNLGRIYAPYNIGGMIASVLVQDAAVQAVTLVDCFTVATDTAKLVAPAGNHNGNCTITASVNGEVKYTLGDASSESSGTGYADVSFRLDIADLTGLADVFVVAEGTAVPKTLYDLFTAETPENPTEPENPTNPETPENPDTPNNPETADEMALGFVVVMMLVSAMALVVLVPKKN